MKTIEKEYDIRLNVPKGLRGAVVPTKVGIVGTKAKVKQAKECIKSIIQYHHHESTHPGTVHEEMAVDEVYYKSIIGRSLSLLVMIITLSALLVWR